MRDITVAIREAVAERILVAERELDAWPRFRDRLNQQHRAILEAIRQGDGDLAAERVDRHIREAHRVLLG
jgi:DNA-binding GntR family transcriptional regulator